MTAAVLTPFTASGAVELAAQTWRKKLLPVGEVEYKGRLLRFTKDYLGQLVRSFNDRAYDQVALQLADAANTHTNDPDRFRGEVTGMEMADDGLYVTVHTTEAGSKVLEENPRLGVSARIVEDYARSDGKHYPAAVQHVLATLDPRIPGLGGWQAIEAATPAPDTVLDLSASTFAEDDMPGDGEIIELDWAKWDAEHGSGGGGSASQKAHDTASATAKATARRHMASKAARKNAATSVRGFKPKSASQLKAGHSIVWGNKKTGALEEHKVVSTSRKANGHVRVTLKGPDGKLHVTSMPPTAQVSYRGAPGDTSLPQVLKQGGFAGLTPAGNPYGLANGSTRAALELAIDILAAAAEEEPPEGTDGMPDLDALTDEQKARLAALLELPDDQLNALAEGGVVVTPGELEALTSPGEDEDGGEQDDGDGDIAAQINAMSDEEFAALEAEFEADGGDGGTTGFTPNYQPEGEPVGASLSAEAQFAIDLAVARQEETARELAVVTARLREEDYQAEKRKLADLGVPPYITELARPVLEGIGRTVELANGKTADAGQIMRKVLTEYAQQARLLDLDVELGSPMDEPEDAGREQADQSRSDVVARYKAMTGLK